MLNKDAGKVWSGFVASMIHDIAKVAEFSGIIKPPPTHEKIDEFLKALQQEYSLESVNIPPEALRLHNTKEGLEGLAMTLADRISKTIQGYPYQLEKNSELTKRRSQEPPRFYPFWGYPCEWNREHMITVFGNIYNYLTKDINVKVLLDIQKEMLTFPHTSYIPHLSLAVHHRFTAAIYYLLIYNLKELTSPVGLQQFKFSIIRVQPNFMDLFYRLRDVMVCQRLNRKLNENIYKQIYSEFGKDLFGIQPWYNPFVFYSEDSMVYIHDKHDKFKQGLIIAFASIEGVRYIELECTDFRLAIEWDSDRLPKRINLDSVDRRKETIVSKKLFSFVKSSMVRCELCQIPYNKDFLKPDDKGNLICGDCLILRTITSGIDLDRVSQSKEGEKRVAFVFVTFPDDLLEHAKDVADNVLIPQFYERIRLPQKIESTQSGLYEYLQSLLDIQRFDETLKEETKKIKGDDKFSANTLFVFPTLKVFLFREDKVWEFLGILNSERLKMQLKMGLKVFICDAKTPFWSLIEGAASHSDIDIFYDVSGEVITMFTGEEVRHIRRIAEMAKNKRVWPTQIHQVSQVALKTSMDELLLEIDIRRDRLKGIEQELKNSLKRLVKTESEYLDREKRAVFIKYIANLSKR